MNGQDYDISLDEGRNIEMVRELRWLEHCLTRGLTPGYQAQRAVAYALDVIQEHLDIDVNAVSWKDA